MVWAEFDTTLWSRSHSHDGMDIWPATRNWRRWTDWRLGMSNASESFQRETSQMKQLRVCRSSRKNVKPNFLIPSLQPPKAKTIPSFQAHSPWQIKRERLKTVSPDHCYWNFGFLVHHRSVQNQALIIQVAAVESSLWRSAYQWIKSWLVLFRLTGFQRKQGEDWMRFVYLTTASNTYRNHQIKPLWGYGTRLTTKQSNL